MYANRKLQYFSAFEKTQPLLHISFPNPFLWRKVPSYDVKYLNLTS